MYWSYQYLSQKLLPETRGVWSVKDIVERTAFLGDELYLTYAPEGVNYTYRETNLAANRIAHSFMKIGLRKGDRLGIFMTNVPDYVFVFYASAKLGLIEVPFNTDLQPAEIAYMINKAEISTIIVEANARFLEVLNRAAEQAPVLKNVIVARETGGMPDTSLKVIINYLALSGILSQLKDTAGKPILPTFQFADMMGAIAASDRNQ